MRPEHPPGCTAIRRRRSSRPSCPRRLRTLSAAASVSLTPWAVSVVVGVARVVSVMILLGQLPVTTEIWAWLFRVSYLVGAAELPWYAESARRRSLGQKSCAFLQLHREGARVSEAVGSVGALVGGRFTDIPLAS